MIERTLMIFGPGGIGKSPIDRIVRSQAVRVDPYRLRSSGPRDGDDIFYAHPKLRAELSGAFQALGDLPERLSTQPAVDWFPKSRTAMFDVCGEWQCLLLGGLSAAAAKAEIYAPALPSLLCRSDVRSVFGRLTMVILNPVASLRSLGADVTSLKLATVENCAKRGDSQKSIDKRTHSIDEEVAAWRAALDAGAIENSHWAFPECAYRGSEVETSVAARAALIAGNSALEAFLKTEAEIGRWRPNTPMEPTRDGS
jgi:hypothetical protein